MKYNKWVLYCLYFSPFLFLIGNIIRIPVPGISIRKSPIMTFDIFMTILILLFFFDFALKNKKTFLLPRGFKIAFFWITLGILSLLFNTIYFNLETKSVFYGSQYIFRFILYLFYGLILINYYPMIKIEMMFLLLVISVTLSAILGFLQYIFFPENISFFTFLDNIFPIYFPEPDPHSRRIVSSFFDPNFYGNFLSIMITVLFFVILYLKHKAARKFIYFFVVIFGAFLLTYSRSAYLNFAISICCGLSLVTISMKMTTILKAIKLGSFIITIALIWGIFIEGSMLQRIIGRFYDLISVEYIDYSASHRYSDWLLGLKVFDLNPIIGVGYNNYGNVIEPIFKIERGIACMFGNDSSWILILATTGIIGLLLYIYMYISIIRESLRVYNITKKPMIKGLVIGYVSGLVGTSVSTMFNNILFYPFFLLIFWMLYSILIIENIHQKSLISRN